MAKSRFSAKAFMEQNENVKSVNSGGFPDVKSGVYDVTVDKSFHKIHDSGAESIKLTFQINDEDENFPNQLIFWNQIIVNKDGSPNEIGCQQVIIMLLALSEGQFDAGEFEEDINSSLESFLLTECRIKLKATKSGEYMDNKIEILSVSNNKHSGLMSLHKKKDTSDEEDTASYVGTQKIKVGQQVQYHTKNGETLATIKDFIETEDGNGMLMLELPNGKVVAANPDDCNIIEEEIEELEKEKELLQSDLKIGDEVKSIFNGESFTGKIYSIDEDTGTAEIVYNNKLRKCKLEDIIKYEIPF